MERINVSENFKIIGGDLITTHGFIMVPNIVLRDRELDHGPKLGFAILISIAQNQTNCTKTHEQLAERAGVSRGTFAKWMKGLDEAGFISVKKRGRGRPSRNELNAQVKVEKGKKAITAYRKGHHINLDGADKYTRSGYTLVPNFILSKKSLNAGEKMTYVLLLSYAWKDKETCQVKQTTLAQQLGVHRQAANRYLKKLKEQKLISIENIGKMEPSIYTLHFKAKS